MGFWVPPYLVTENLSVPSISIEVLGLCRPNFMSLYYLPSHDVKKPSSKRGIYWKSLLKVDVVFLQFSKLHFSSPTLEAVSLVSFLMQKHNGVNTGLISHNTARRSFEVAFEILTIINLSHNLIVNNTLGNKSYDFTRRKLLVYKAALGCNLVTDRSSVLPFCPNRTEQVN